MLNPLLHWRLYCGQQLRVESAQFCSEQGELDELAISDQVPTPTAASMMSATNAILSLDLLWELFVQLQDSLLQQSLPV